MSHRINRINEEMKKALSTLIKNQIKDPRISELLSITQVDVTNDLRYAKVFISVYDDKEKQKDTLKGLESAAGLLRREVGKKIRLRYTPELLFEIDHSIEYGMHIESILKNINESED